MNNINTVAAENAARLHAKREVRMLLGDIVYKQIMHANFCAEGLAELENPKVKDSNAYRNLMETLAAIKVYMEELK